MIDSKYLEEIIQEYSSKKDLFSTCSVKIKSLAFDLLKNNSIQVHNIESRVKSLDSLKGKIQKKSKYKSLSEITDIIGVRIITYLESDVDEVHEVIENNFTIDKENSIDKRKLELNQFGYRSLHLVAEFGANRLSLPEYSNCKGIKFEFQIRSILQHAWAEIEHDLGYKSKSSLPESKRRSFNRLAALLETADIEFDRLKTSLTKYEQEVPELIKLSPEIVNINQPALETFTKNNEVLASIRDHVKTAFNSEFSDEQDSYEEYIDKFKSFDINNIGDLQTFVEQNKEDYLLFVKKFVNSEINKNLKFSLPVFWLQHYLAAKTKNKEKIAEYLGIPGSINSTYVLEFMRIINEIEGNR